MSLPEHNFESAGSSSQQIVGMATRGCQVAQLSAAALHRGIVGGSVAELEAVKKYEEELDLLDRQINDGVTALIPQVSSPPDGRELLACLKFIIELERIGDLLLNVENRYEAIGTRLDPYDQQQLASMASMLEGMLGSVSQAFAERDVRRALTVLRADSEMDRIRNLLFIRHVENPEKHPVRESYHLIFMVQSLERAGDHAKNLAEEICHLVTGRSFRHLQREYDKPVELIAMERARGRKA